MEQDTADEALDEASDAIVGGAAVNGITLSNREAVALQGMYANLDRHQLDRPTLEQFPLQRYLQRAPSIDELLRAAQVFRRPPSCTSTRTGTSTRTPQSPHSSSSTLVTRMPSHHHHPHPRPRATVPPLTARRPPSFSRDECYGRHIRSHGARRLRPQPKTCR